MSPGKHSILSSIKRRLNVILPVNLFLLDKIVFFKDLCIPCTRRGGFSQLNNRIDFGIRHTSGSRTVKASVAEWKRGSDNSLLLPYSTSAFVILRCISCFDATSPNQSPWEGGSEHDPNLAEADRLGASHSILLGQRQVLHHLQRWTASCHGVQRDG